MKNLFCRMVNILLGATAANKEPLFLLLSMQEIDQTDVCWQIFHNEWYFYSIHFFCIFIPHFVLLFSTRWPSTGLCSVNWNFFQQWCWKCSIVFFPLYSATKTLEVYVPTQKQTIKNKSTLPEIKKVTTNPSFLTC